MLCVLAQLCIVLTQGSSLGRSKRKRLSGLTGVGNFSRVVLWTLGPLYVHSILYSLVRREDLKNILAGTLQRRVDPIEMGVGALPLDSVGSIHDAKARSGLGGPAGVSSDVFEVRLGAEIV
jgi:hypothetical protein